MKRIRVLIVEDSPVVREHLSRIISSDARLEVAGVAESAEEALEMLDRVRPDVISLDLRLPGMQGLEATRRIMTRRPTPIVVVAAVSDDLNPAMEALKTGALALVEKPAAATDEHYAAVASRLCTQLAIMSEVKVLRQHRPTERSPFTAPRPRERGRFEMVGIAASTGGPNALVKVLTALGPRFGLPVVVVQHMSPGFVDAFGAWLAGVVPFKVKVVGESAPLEASNVYLARADRHIAVDRECARTLDTPPVGNHRPSGNVLFESMARNIGAAAIGVLLTGMGEDGAAGLLGLRRAGGFTIAESESTAVVFGMPEVAARMGAATEVLPLDTIGPRIAELARAHREGF